MRTDYYNYINVSELDLNDRIFSIGLDKETFRTFKVTDGPLRMYDFRDNVQMAVTYEFSRDLTVTRRKVYGFLDFMGDLGGLASSLHASLSLTIIILQYRAAMSYVSNHTYLIQDGDELDSVSKANSKQIKHDSGGKQDGSDKMMRWGTRQRNISLKRIPIGFWASMKLSL